MKKNHELSDQEAKNMLDISSWRELSKDKFMKFAEMVPQMKSEEAIAAISQFPNAAGFVAHLSGGLLQSINGLLENNKDSNKTVYEGYQTLLKAIIKRMEDENIPHAEFIELCSQSVNIADKIAEIDKENKRFLINVLKGTGEAVLSLGGLVVGLLYFNGKLPSKN